MLKAHGWRRLLVTTGLGAVLIAAGLTATAYGLTGHARHYHRPSGIPAGITDSQANLMELSPVPERPAPGFTLTDQDGRVLSLSAFRGKVVVLELMDPHCTDICPIVSAEFGDAYHDLGRLAGQVVFAAVNVNQYHHAVADVVHSSAVYFIDPSGRERYLASPQADHTAAGASYLPADQIAAWGQGIARVAGLLAS